ncbi:hypothetical protein [Aureivirga sp. CE67]|uniref:hypothetical protein n=1 Tax=Aureivirga sp. CE67 TaxID=1788983 RepID=UPI0018CA2BCC|nr:hypothetical protein [Aureivirga sp. CE67]
MKIKLFLFLVVCSITTIFAQDEGLISYMKGKNDIIYIDNSPGTHFTINFPGDSLKPSNIPNSVVIGEDNIQFLKKRYTSDQYTNQSGVKKEIELLEYYMNYELDYLEKEVFEKDIVNEKEVFLNNSGKRFLLWYYEMPEIASPEGVEIIDPVTANLFLNFISNDYLIGVNFSVFKSEDKKAKIEKLKSIANTVNIFGGPIDENALWYKIDALNDDKNLSFTDTINKFELEIPKWANITKTQNKSLWMASMPDIDNIKNIISLKWFDQSEFKSLEEFNKAQIEGYKIGDKMSSGATMMLKKKIEKPEKCNGVAYEMQLLFGSMIYHCQYVTYYSDSAYFMIGFIATENTYNRNLVKFNEFLEKFEIQN